MWTKNSFKFLVVMAGLSFAGLQANGFPKEFSIFRPNNQGLAGKFLKPYSAQVTKIEAQYHYYDVWAALPKEMQASIFWRRLVLVTCRQDRKDKKEAVDAANYWEHSFADKSPAEERTVLSPLGRATAGTGAAGIGALLVGAAYRHRDALRAKLFGKPKPAAVKDESEDQKG